MKYEQSKQRRNSMKLESRIQEEAPEIKRKTIELYVLCQCSWRVPSILPIHDRQRSTCRPKTFPTGNTTQLAPSKIINPSFQPPQQFSQLPSVCRWPALAYKTPALGQK